MTKIAFIGAGYMAQEHIKAFQSIDGVMISGIMGRSEDKVNKLAKDYNIPFTAKTVAELYEGTLADALVIAVNELNSPAIINQALDFPWVILAEKPVSLDLNEAKEIEEKRAKLNRNIFVAMNRRHYASTRQSLTVLENDTGPRVVEVHDQENIIAAAASNSPKEVISSWMVANSIHLIDYFNIFCRGKLTEVNINKELDINDPFFTSSFLKYDSGDIGVYHAVWNAPGPWSVKVTTRHQMLEMRPLEGLEFQVFPEKRKQAVDLPQDDKTHKPGLLIQAFSLIAASKGLEHNLPSLKDYIATHRLVTKLYPQALKV